MAITPATGLITPCVCVCVLCGRRNLGGVRGRGGTETTEDRPFPSRGLVARWLLYKEWGVCYGTARIGLRRALGLVRPVRQPV